MKTIINHSYNVHYVPTPTFEWKKYSDIVDLTGYQNRIMPYMPGVIKLLKLEPGNRYTLIVVNSPDFPTCLISLQFQYFAGVIYITANYRSQCSALGRPIDSNMLKFLATILSRALNTNFIKIRVNVANYHLSDLAKSLR